MELVSHVLDVYSRIDQEIAAFQLKTGLRCPTGCGLCCPTADVQTTVIEMLPAAREILYRGESTPWLERIQAEGIDSVCVFYQKQSLPHAPGHCSMYTLRPSVCRLFGFAAVRDRLGAQKLAVCKHLKKSDPDAVAMACKKQGEAPRYTDFSTMLLSLDLTRAHLMPINAALKEAITRSGLCLQMTHAEALGNKSAA
ncbi:MAG: YkgJ family cysteine cluster protein [Desulfobacteraceae bacterium]|nr:MAG: YkgJ family cysteine cluster protein [Desulfobacteraceae bacterium]